MEMLDDLVMWLGIVAVVVGPLWVILHYTTKWRQAPKITQEDEKLLDELHMLARRLEDRVNTVERIVAADDPDFRARLSAGQGWQPAASPAPTYQIDRRN